MLPSAPRFAALIIPLVCSAPVLATTYSWTLQTISTAPSNPDQVGLGMGRGQVWPAVVFGSNSDVKGSTLTPVGWQETTLGQRVGMSQTTIRAGSAPDGRVGAVWVSPNGITLAQTSKTGWETTPFTVSLSGTPTVDFAYSTLSKPTVAYVEQGQAKISSYDGTTWNAESVAVGTTPVNSNLLSTAIDSLDRVGVAYSLGSGVGFVMKDPVLGTWQKYTAPTGQLDPLLQTGTVNHISLAFGPNDEAGMLLTHYDGYTYAWFDIRSGTWKAERVIQTGYTQGRFSNLTFDSTGAAAFAYIDSSGSGYNVHYRRRVGLGWQDVVLPARAASYAGNASLAFDAEDLPVIAFRSDTSPYNLVLAYDPIVVPEPASALLLALGCIVLRRRGN